MNGKKTQSAIARHCDLGSMRSRDALNAAIEMYLADPRFALPPELADTVVARGDFIVCGSTPYAQIFMRAAREAGLRVHAAIDDFRGGLECVGAPIVASRDLSDFARRFPGLIAVNCGRNDRAVRHFDSLCDGAGVPVVTFEQALRLCELGDRVDYRVADWGPTIGARAGEFMALADRLADDGSRETLYSVMLFHLTGNMEWIHAVSRPYPTLYFRSGLFTVGSAERFVDCGASIGESTGGLLALTRNRVERVWMIEPDKFNHQKLESLVNGAWSPARDRIRLIKAAAGSRPGRMPFNHVGGHTGSICVESHRYGQIDEVEIISIDDIVDAPPTMIKMDIEGAELDAMKGAERAIREARPLLAISAYHRPTDLLDLPAYVDGIAPGYRIGLRHHTEERYDTCLYFMPE